MTMDFGSGVKKINKYLFVFCKNKKINHWNNEI